MKTGWAHGTDRVDFIAREDDDLVFVLAEITEDRGDGFPLRGVRPGGARAGRGAYLAQADGDAGYAVRFDFVSMIVIGDSRAFLRHHRNCLSEA